MGTILNALVGWKGYVAAALLAAVVAAGAAWRVTSWADAGTIESLKGKYSHQVDLTGAAQANFTTERNAVKTCADGVAKLKKDSDDRVAAANAELARLRAERAKKPDPAATILAAPPPPAGTDLCKAADALILEAVQ